MYPLTKRSSFEQLDALLPTVTPKQSHLPPLEKCLFELHSILTSLPSISPNLPLAAAAPLKTHGVSVPWPTPTPTAEAKFKVGFERPADIKVTGSWANKLSVMAKDGEGFNVDLTLTMPPVGSPTMSFRLLLTLTYPLLRVFSTKRTTSMPASFIRRHIIWP